MTALTSGLRQSGYVYLVFFNPNHPDALIQNIRLISIGLDSITSPNLYLAKSEKNINRKQ